MDTKRVIELKGVSIYQGEVSRKANAENNLVLSNVNLAVDEGEFVYLIGRVGTGKSTLLKALYAEIDIVEGEATVVGFDLRNIKRSGIPMLRRSMGIVFQDFQLLTDRNVFLNLYDVMRATGWKSEEDIRRRISEVLELVGLEHKSYKMPFELSGGEQQRLTIARALIRGARILILDDSSSALDYATDAALRASLHTLPNSPTVFIISQRTSSIRHADLILVMEDGRLVDQGKHDELLSRCEVYREIHESQFKKGGDEA